MGTSKSDTSLSFFAEWDYDSAPVVKRDALRSEGYGSYVNGANTASDPKGRIEISSPVEFAVNIGAPELVSMACEQARAASESWRAIAPAERTRLLWEGHKAVSNNARALAGVTSLTTGIPVRLTLQNEVHALAQAFRRYGSGVSEAGQSVLGSVVATPESLVVAARTLPKWLAAGSGVIYIATARAVPPLQHLIEILEGAGLPSGLVNLVALSDEHLVEGASLLKNQLAGAYGDIELCRRIRSQSSKLSEDFTWSSPTALRAVVCRDADLTRAAEAIVQGALGYCNGFSCCGARVYVEEAVESELVRRIRDRLRTVVLGCPGDQNTDLGPVCCNEVKEAFDSVLNDLDQTGFDVEYGSEAPEDGLWRRPTLVSKGAQSSPLHSLSALGPIVFVQSVRTLQEGISKANNTLFTGLVMVWSSDPNSQLKVFGEIDAPTLYVNSIPRESAFLEIDLASEKASVLKLSERPDSVCPSSNSQRPGQCYIEGAFAEGGFSKLSSALKSARTGFSNWNTTCSHNRADWLMRFAQETSRIGWQEGADLVQEGVCWIEKHGGALQATALSPDSYIQVEHQPVGVVIAVLPKELTDIKVLGWLTTVIATGNSVVLLSHEETFHTCQALCQIAHMVSFPKGVINHLPAGSHEELEALGELQGVDLVICSEAVRLQRPKTFWFTA